MLFKNISIVNENFQYEEGVDVIIEGDRITQISNESIECDDEDVFNGKDYIMMPGFYNSHTHSSMSLMRGYGENLNLQDWLFTKVFPFEDKLTDEDVYYGTLLSIAESFRFGTVSFSDMYYFLDSIVAAAIESGAKMNVSRAMANPEGLPFDSLPSTREMYEFYNKYHNTGDGKILIDASIHAEYTSNEDTVVRVSEWAKENNIRMHIHLSETLLEHEECKVRHEGRTPAKYFFDCGVFEVPTNAAHSVWVSDEDIRIMADNNVCVSTNPISNLKLASGICDVKKLMDAGITVGIGTDSSASNNNLSMFEEMKTMMLLAKVKNNDPTLISPREALMMATRNGALIQGRDDAGLIKEGFKADLILIEKNSPNMHPVHDMIGNLVLSASDQDVYLTMVDGRIVYEDGEFKTIDIDDVIKGVDKSVKDVLSRL